MAAAFWGRMQDIWPLSIFKHDDLRLSDERVRRLSIPEATRKFIYAVGNAKARSVVYVLSAQNLSEQSALDVECVIKEVKPDAVVVQAGCAAASRLLSEEREAQNNGGENIPTSLFGVVKRCFIDKINKEKYESMAGRLVLQEIFGIGLHGHVLTAKTVAREVGSCFLILETPFVKSDAELDPRLTGLRLGAGLVPWQTNFRRSQGGGGHKTPPAFAQSIYPLLVDLHDMVSDELPTMGRALAFSHKMVHDVNRGRKVERQTMSEVGNFRTAVEHVRAGLNRAGKSAMSKQAKVEFSELSAEEKSHAVLAQALKSQANKFKSVVAVVDAGSLGGIRKHWNTAMSAEMKDLVGQLCVSCERDEAFQRENEKWVFSSKPMVALGAGATAAIGVSSIPKVMTMLQLLLTHASKVVAPGLAKSGLSPTVMMKTGASAGKIRLVVRGAIASIERTSLSAMRAAFYEIMRKWRVQPIGILPWATFGCSIATCSGLLLYHDGIECAAESIPSAPSIATLGRGIKSMLLASQEMRKTTVTSK